MLLLAPSKISEKLDEMYRPEKALDKLLEGMVCRGADDPQRCPSRRVEHLRGGSQPAPVVRLVDLIISEAFSPRERHPHRAGRGGVAVRYASTVCCAR